MTKITMPDGTIVETDSAEVVRVALKLAPPPTAEPPASSGQIAAKRAPGTNSSARLTRDSAEPVAPPAPAAAHWTAGEIGQFAGRLPDTALSVFRILRAAGRKWTDGTDISKQTNIQPKGLGSVVSSMTRLSQELGMASPLEKHSERMGKTRVTRFRLSADFLAVLTAATENTATQ